MSGGPEDPVRLSVRELAKRWGPGSRLRPTTFDVAAGSLVVVRGRSGSGKSTLLSVLAGWCPPDGGEVVLDGAVVDLAAQPWHRVSVVPQVLALVPELTVRENLALGLGRSGARDDAAARPDASRRLDDVLGLLDLTDLAGRFPDEISMGQQQRAAVGRAVVGAPSVVLADEPTSHQDVTHADLVVAALREATRQGSGVLVASHDRLVADAADLVVDLDV